MSDFSVAIITPVHSRDYGRFCLQRRSFEECGVDIEHVAVVNDENVKLFEKTPFRRNLRVVGTSDVLPAHIERRRRSIAFPRKDPRRWWLARGKAPIHGWALQQLIKLAAPVFLKRRAVICMDADTFFVRRVLPEEFFTENKTHLYETSSGIDAEMAEWPARAMRFLKVPPTGRNLFRYTHSPVVFDSSVVNDLHSYIEKMSGRDWMSAIVDTEMIMEYTLYGVFAREIDRLRRVFPRLPTRSLHFWWPKEVEQLELGWTQVQTDDEVAFVGVQSNTACSPERILPLAEAVWKIA
jgi:hypothetical protein